MGEDCDAAQEMPPCLTLPSDEADLWDLTKENCEKEKMMMMMMMMMVKHRHRRKLPPAEPAQPLQLAKHSTRGPNHRPKHSNNWALGGRGMQAFFLDSTGRSTGGTGVFLPQAAGTNNSQPHRKLACAPVLLPSRVVQALNLNVHALGLQISPRTDYNAGDHKNYINSKKGIGEQSRNSTSSLENINEEEGAVGNCRVAMSPPRSASSPEIFLPKEWTY